MEARSLVQTAPNVAPGTLEALERSFVLVLAGEFQGFARELHYEVAEFIATVMARRNQTHFTIIRNNLTKKRELDTQNAKPQSLLVDFERLGISDLWVDITNANPSGQLWRQHLGDLNAARNTIAPNGLGSLPASSASITISHITTWRATCDQVTSLMDSILNDHLFTLTGLTPW
jgi:hypothetical protein